MSSHRFKTMLSWHDGAGNECEAEVTVHYDRHKAFAGDLTDPPEAASVEITAITGMHSGVPGLFYEDDSLLEACMQDWAEDIAAAAEYRADQRRDDAMLERGR